MIGNLYRVSEKDLEEILKDSSILESKVYADEGENLEDLLDLDKSWEAIFYLLTGCSIAEIEDAQAPLSWSLFSGQIVDEEQDMGYGPAHYLRVDQVKQLDAELDKISIDELKGKYNGQEMNEAGIYPEVWDREESLDYVTDYFEQLKEFYKIASEENKAVITFLN